MFVFIKYLLIFFLNISVFATSEKPDPDDEASAAAASTTAPRTAFLKKFPFASSSEFLPTYRLPHPDFSSDAIKCDGDRAAEKMAFMRELLNIGRSSSHLKPTKTAKLYMYGACVVKQYGLDESTHINGILKCLINQSYPFVDSFSFCLPRATISLGGGNFCTVYDKAPGVEFYHLLKKYKFAGAEEQLKTKEFLKSLGQSLFAFQEHFRPSETYTDDPICYKHAHFVEQSKLNLPDYDASARRYLLAPAIGDLHPGNIFVDSDKITIIDYVSLARFLKPEGVTYSCATYDLAYFIACTRVYSRNCYKLITTAEFNDLMAIFLAGYMQGVPEPFRPVLMCSVWDIFRALLVAWPLPGHVDRSGLEIYLTNIPNAIEPLAYAKLTAVTTDGVSGK